ncbi:MAG: hypothetical protein KME31_09900 [Tolypothrix carrinoi HA7290-LM1]|jgi:hypothetical protein|nr:hypothetical protein [Tolypothrix carrinoi HA7290-LM1]
MGHRAWGRQCGLGVGPAWSICRHGAWGLEKELLPIAQCPLPNAHYPLTTNQQLSTNNLNFGKL